MARIVRREIRKRGFIGKLFLGVFILFNALMAFWLFSYWVVIGGQMNTGDEWQQAGTAIGATMGTGMLLFLWLAGAVILGLFTILTRGSKVIVEETE